MKTIIATLNAKYIHTSLALRWLYVANKDRFDLSFREYTIKEDVKSIAEDLLATDCDCIGLGIYIWNVNRMPELIALLKAGKPDLVIILGGPEVSYEPEYFLQNKNVDFVVGGEGEFVLGELLYALENDLLVNIDGVSFAGQISKKTAKADLVRLAALPSPYQLEEDRNDLPHRLVYFETSRGCPYRCAYCLSSLERGVRYFPGEYVRNNLHYLIEADVRQIKFLDRTFNLNKKHTRSVFDFLIRHHRPGLSCQFEVYAELLDEETLDRLNELLPPRFFRFEIGIQSSYEPSNRAVNRKQDFALLSRNIRRITKGGKIGLHLDLIAGLPFESFERFRQSFNDVFGFRSKEVQLGFLKMLRGTELRAKASEYGYRYQEKAPYEIISDKWLSVEDLQRIKEAEHILDKYWNSGRFPLTMDAVFDRFYRDRYFDFFDELAGYGKQQGFDFYHYQLGDLFRYLDDFLQNKEIPLSELLREDYYGNFTIRPTGKFRPDTIGKSERKSLLQQISNDKNFLAAHHLTSYALRKQTMIDTLTDNQYLLNVFLPEGRKTVVYSFEEK